MFKCSDCGQEFNIKPDFCDCGNNVFEEIKEQKIQQSEEKDNDTIIFQPQRKEEKPKTTLNIDIASLLIFFLCIVLSVLSVIYIGKDSLAKLEQEKNQPKEKKIRLSENKNIPSIDKIWKDTVLKVEVEPEKQPEPVKQVEPVVKKQETKTFVQPVKEKPKTTKQVVSKSVTPKVTQQVKPQTQTPVVKTVQQKPEEIKTNTKPTVTVNTNESKQELASYKVALRNKIAHSINFTKIIGDGDCAVSFKIDNAGNLTNRHFSKQSDNDSLNDAVYYAIMANPTYNSPPSSYKNETLTFSVSMYGGRYQVTLR